MTMAAAITIALTFMLVLLAMTLPHAAWLALNWSRELSGVAGLLNANGTHARRRLHQHVVGCEDGARRHGAGHLLAERFMAFERTIIPSRLARTDNRHKSLRIVMTSS